MQRAGRGTGLKRSLPIFAVAALAAVSLDQLTKMLVRSALGVGASIEVLKGVVWVTHVRNSGGAFSIMQGRIPVFVASAIVVIGVAMWYMIAHRPQRRRVAVALGLIVGGAIGNLIDRVVTGRVTDFIDFQVFPVFNAADIAIVAGMTLLVWILLTQPDDPEASGVGSNDG